MIKIKDKVENKIEYPLDTFGNTDQIIFFDIETTGFSRKYCMIYLIGCMYFVNDTPYYIQWFAENSNEESNILMAFHKFLKNFKIIIHFNGTTFDMPFIKERGEKYRLDFDFNKFEIIDIYQSVKNLSHILKLENTKQKTFETFLGIKRKDPFSGGDLIEVYKEFLRRRDEMLVLPLLLHNKEDVENMGSLTALFALSDLFSNKYLVTEYNKNNYTDINGNSKNELVIKLKLDNSIPFSISYKYNDIYFQASKNIAQISVKISDLLLKYFFNNYKDYYYLPLEDKALHKSVAAYVDKEYRTQAKKSTCYTKVSDSFLPLYSIKSNTFTQIFVESYGDKEGYIQASQLNSENIKFYASHILHILSEKKLQL